MPVTALFTYSASRMSWELVGLHDGIQELIVVPASRLTKSGTGKRIHVIRAPPMDIRCLGGPFTSQHHQSFQQH